LIVIDVLTIMDIITQITQNKDLIEKSMIRYGYDAEHYYYCFLYNIENYEQPHIFRFDDDALILAKYDKDDNDWYIFVGILAPKEKMIIYLKEFLIHAFGNGCRKVWVEFSGQFRKQLLKELPEYKINRNAYTLTWPVFDMKQWNGDKMEGKDWKDMRYYWNKFFRDHKVERRAYIAQDKPMIKELISRWKKERNGTDRTYEHYYLSALENDFVGYETRVIIVDGLLCAITAGYKLPNRNYYYSSIGIVCKEYDRIGEIANMDDLIECKKKGYEFVDFGGGEEHLTAFKKKFKPTYYYESHVFSIERKNDTDKKNQT
jgi:hypothetical protein